MAGWDRVSRWRADASLLVVIAKRMRVEALTGGELALLGAGVAREGGKFDFRTGKHDLSGESSRTFKATLDAIHGALQQVTNTITTIADTSDVIARENHVLWKWITVQANGLKGAHASITQLARRSREPSVMRVSTRASTPEGNFMFACISSSHPIDATSACASMTSGSWPMSDRHQCTG